MIAFVVSDSALQVLNPYTGPRIQLLFDRTEFIGGKCCTDEQFVVASKKFALRVRANFYLVQERREKNSRLR